MMANKEKNSTSMNQSSTKSQYSDQEFASDLSNANSGQNAAKKQQQQKKK